MARLTPIDAWHALTVEEACQALATDKSAGLSAADAAARLDALGANRLVDPPPAPAWKAFLRQFNDLLIRVLIAAGVLSAVIGDINDVTVIAAVIVLNAVVGFVQERRAEAALLALKRMLNTRTEVRRDGREGNIPAEHIVPGDIVLLEPGDRIPADGRLVVAQSLRVDESSLTGESEASLKQAARALDADAPLGDRSNMAFMNTVVAAGRGELLVTATGMASEIGRVAGMLGATEQSATPLQRRLNHLGRRLATFGLALIAGIFTLDLVRGEALSDAIADAIALAVASIPEGLPTVVTVTLALGAFRMAKRGAILRRLAAVETLGSTTVICTDKTGTLTLNQMTVRAIACGGNELLVTGEGYSTDGAIITNGHTRDFVLRPMLETGVLCNDSRLVDGTVLGDPTEGALLALAAKSELDAESLSRARPRVAELPFDHDRKLMVTFHVYGSVVEAHVKGAPEAVLRRCTSALTGAGAQALTPDALQTVMHSNDRLARRGLRVLALASKSVTVGNFRADGDLLAAADGLTLTGLVGMADPPRSEAKQAVADCRSAGIEVKMITGDQPSTAAAIARELGLHGRTIAGAELDALNDEQLTAVLDDVAVIARATPEHKVRIVRALKAGGHVVAMTGDGVNDAPALKEADIGVAMGKSGTEVAKQASAMVLADDNFATIVGAVREGRNIYENIVKFVRFQLTTTVAALTAVTAAPLLGLPEPFAPIHILWIAIIMDGPPAIALGFDAPRPGLMADPPRDPSETLLTPDRLRRLALTGVAMAVGTLVLFAVARDSTDPKTAQTLVFSTFVFFQIFNAFNVRSEYGTVFTRQLWNNRPLWAALGLVIALQVMVVSAPFAQDLFQTTSLSPAQWGVALGVGASILVLDEAGKRVVRLWLKSRKQLSHARV